MTDEEKKTVNVIRSIWAPDTAASLCGDFDDIHELLDVIDSQEKRIEFLTGCLEKIRQHGNMTGEDAVWMQQTAAHGIKPERWPMPGEKPLSDLRLKGGIQ